MKLESAVKAGMKEHDVVKLKEANEKLGIKTSNLGTIVAVHVPCKVFTVEFFDDYHNTIPDSLYTEYTINQLELVWSYGDAPKEVYCPLVDVMIESVDCVETRDIADDHFIDSTLLARFKRKPNWQELCKSCEWHNFN